MFFQFAKAQLVYEDRAYREEIKTIQLFNAKQEQSTPILLLGSEDVLELRFDDLSAEIKNFYYTIEHCTWDWKSSNLSTIDYMDGFGDEPINDYRFSLNTLQPYVHYTTRFPNFNVRPLISGNYILKVYENNDQKNLVLTRRFFVIETKVGIQSEFTFSSSVEERDRQQKINFSIRHPRLAIGNPFDEVKVVITQNDRWDNSQKITRPIFVRANELVYEEVDAGTFNGGNEFRLLDSRTLRFKSENILLIVEDKKLFNIYLKPEGSRNIRRYTSNFDNNGKFFIRFQEGTSPEIEADYTYTHFKLLANNPVKGKSVFLSGGFTNWSLHPNYRLFYDEQERAYVGTYLLKQGVYDYQYLVVDEDSKNVDEIPFEGSFYQTENNYTIYVYYRKPGSRFDELIGTRSLNTVAGIR